MPNMDAIEQYQKAFKAAHKEYKELLAAGKNPHPAVLDEILPEGFGSNYQSIGLVEIPAHRIVGTKAAGRITAKLTEKGIPNELLVPDRKDWNEELLHNRKEEAKSKV